jgi:hypothetical protein
VSPRAAGGVGDLLQKARAAGGLGKLLSTGGGIASAAGAIGGIVAGGGAIVSALQGVFAKRVDPAEAEAQRATVSALQQTTAALHELSTKIGALNTTGTGAVSARSADIAGSLAGRVAANPALTGRDIGANLVSLLGDAGLSFDQFKQAAAALGVTLTDAAHVTAEQLRAIAAAADLLGNKTRGLEDTWTILGTDAAGKLRDFIAAAKQVPEALDNQTGSVAAAVEQIDTTTQAGRDQAIALVRDAFRAGTITADVAKEFVALITALAPTAPAADAAASALDRLNGSLSDIALIGDVVGKSVDGVFQAIDDAAAGVPEVRGRDPPAHRGARPLDRGRAVAVPRAGEGLREPARRGRADRRRARDPPVPPGARRLAPAAHRRRHAGRGRRGHARGVRRRARQHRARRRRRTPERVRRHRHGWRLTGPQARADRRAEAASFNRSSRASFCRQPH